MRALRSRFLFACLVLLTLWAGIGLAVLGTMVHGTYGEEFIYRPALKRRLGTTANQSLSFSRVSTSSSSCLGRDRATGRLTLPNVLLIGAQKSGTTSLAQWLNQAGGVCESELFANEPMYYKKEPHYFDKRYGNSTAYAQRFAHCCRDASKTPVLAMDATPNTMLYPKRVRSTYDSFDPTGSLAKGVKILAILRDPSARELSWYNHLSFDCREILNGNKNLVGYAWEACFGHRNIREQDTESNMLSFAEYITSNTMPMANYVPEPPNPGGGRQMSMGMYAAFLREWMELFDRNQILLLSQNEMVTDTDAFLGRVQSFLSLNSSVLDHSFPRSNDKDDGKKVKRMLCSDQKRLRATFDPMNKDLYTLLEENPGPVEEEKPFPKFSAPECTN